MTDALVAALVALTPVERKILRTSAAEAKTGWLAALLAGLVAEVTELEWQEEIERVKTDAMMYRFELDRIADMQALTSDFDWPDLPPGEPWWPENPTGTPPYFEGREA